MYNLTTQQTFSRWPDTNLVYINRINISGLFTISSKPLRISVVYDKSEHGQFLSYVYESKWINLFYIGTDSVKTNCNNTASQVISTDRKCS